MELLSYTRCAPHTYVNIIDYPIPTNVHGPLVVWAINRENTGRIRAVVLMRKKREATMDKRSPTTLYSDSW